MPFQGQWADSLLAIERVHALRLALWAAFSILAGCALITGLRLQRAESDLLRHFAIQCAAWGAVLLAVALWMRRTLELRDLAGAVALDRLVWFSLGLEFGCVALGAALALVGWSFGRRLGLVGAGLGIVVQGLALLVLDLQFAAAIVR